MSQLTPEEIQGLNKTVRKFGSKISRKAKGAAVGSLREGFRNRNRYQDGVIEALSFKFPRYGVFREMGVFGGKTRKQLIAEGKLKPKPWFNPAIDAELPLLDQALLDEYENFVVNAAQIRIKNTEL